MLFFRFFFFFHALSCVIPKGKYNHRNSMFSYMQWKNVGFASNGFMLKTQEVILLSSILRKYDILESELIHARI